MTDRHQTTVATSTDRQVVTTSCSACSWGSQYVVSDTEDVTTLQRMATLNARVHSLGG